MTTQAISRSSQSIRRRSSRPTLSKKEQESLKINSREKWAGKRHRILSTREILAGPEQMPQLTPWLIWWPRKSWMTRKSSTCLNIWRCERNWLKRDINSQTPSDNWIMPNSETARWSQRFVKRKSPALFTQRSYRYPIQSKHRLLKTRSKHDSWTWLMDWSHTWWRFSTKSSYRSKTFSSLKYSSFRTTQTVCGKILRSWRAWIRTVSNLMRWTQRL